MKLIQTSGLPDNKVVILEGISDDELRWCYEHASALVSASLNEGFGIPLIEAQYFGVPLIVSDIEPYREIAGAAAVFFDPLSERALTQSLLDNDQLNGHAEVVSSMKEYSWEASAGELAALFMNPTQDTLSPPDEI